MSNRSAREETDLTRFAKKIAIVISMVLFVALLWFVRRVLVLIVVAAILAAGIAPIVRRVRVLVRLYTGRKIRRGPAVLIVYFPVLILFTALAVVVVPQLMTQSDELLRQIPTLVNERILRPLGPVLGIDSVQDLLSGGGEGDIFQGASVAEYLRNAVGLVVSVVAVLFMIVYMLIDAERLRNLFLLFYPSEERATKRRMINRIAKRMSSWLSAQLLLAGIVGGATLLGLLLLGIPYAFPLSLIAALGEMVPVIGPILGAIPALGVSLFQSRWQFWAVLALAIGIQQVENYFLVPRVMGSKVAVSPLSVFIAFLVGGSLLGVIGALLAIPVTVIVQVVFEEAFVRRRERRQDANRPGTLINRADG